MDAASNVFSYSVGAIALVSTVVSVLFFLRLFFPAPQMKILDAVLLETKTLYQKVDAEGLLPVKVSKSVQVKLNEYDVWSDAMREATFRAISTLDKIRAIFKGQTQKIMHLTREVQKLRSFIMTASQRERMRRARDPELLGLLRACGQDFPSCDIIQGLDLGLEVNAVSPVPTSCGDTSTAPTPPEQSSISPPIESAPSLSQEPSLSSTCFLCSFKLWWKLRTSREAEMPLPVTSSPSSDPGLLSRSSTLVNQTAFNPSPLRRSWFGFAKPTRSRDGRCQGEPSNEVSVRWCWNHLRLWVTRPAASQDISADQLDFDPPIVSLPV
ncbi:hypothetical protein Hypma_012976 [Hypsizygus marmoreus]|uniref:Uncharacterized protein n=1 Tax=Hypsizygus marmoreus TaxID=39966 RepID=A0A369JDE8_HYPMA|nr:hypothetical protein Hypma_012976 [Hypsizygus marmoreus]